MLTIRWKGGALLSLKLLTGKDIAFTDKVFANMLWENFPKWG